MDLNRMARKYLTTEEYRKTPQRKFWCDVDIGGHIVSFESNRFTRRSDAINFATSEMKPLVEGWLFTTYRNQTVDTVRIVVNSEGLMKSYDPTNNDFINRRSDYGTNR